MSQQHQRQIAKYLPHPGIRYLPDLAIAFGSVNAGIILSQLLYWHGTGKRRDGWIYKTEQEFYQETGLTRSKQDSALKILIDSKVVAKKLAQIPAKRHFKLDFVLLQEILPSLLEKRKLEYMKPPVVFDDKMKPITKSTPETTTKNTIHDKDTYIKSRRRLNLDMDLGSP